MCTVLQHVKCSSEEDVHCFEINVLLDETALLPGNPNPFKSSLNDLILKDKSKISPQTFRTKNFEGTYINSIKYYPYFDPNRLWSQVNLLLEQYFLKFNFLSSSKIRCILMIEVLCLQHLSIKLFAVIFNSGKVPFCTNSNSSRVPLLLIKFNF